MRRTTRRFFQSMIGVIVTVGLVLGCGAGPEGSATPSVADGSGDDAAGLDADRADADSLDVAAPDAGTSDAGTSDAGTSDAGTPDAGTPDAGTPDAEDPTTVVTLTTPDGTTPLPYRSYGFVRATGGGFIFAQTLQHRIFRLSATGATSLLAGSTPGYVDATGAAARFQEPHGIAVDANDVLLIADTNNHRIRRVDGKGVVSTIAGSGSPGVADGVGSAAQFNQPQGLVAAGAGVIFVADTENDRVRRIGPQGAVTTLAGSSRGFADGQGAAAKFSFVFGVVMAPKTGLYVSDVYNHRVRHVTLAGLVSTYAGSGQSGAADGPAGSATFNQPHGLALAPGGALYVADMLNHRIRKISAAGLVTTIAGSSQGLLDGAALQARFNKPYALTFVPPASLFVADTYNYRLRQVEGVP